MLFRWETIPSNMWFWLILVGIASFFYQFFVTRAYSYVAATKVCSLAYGAVFFGAIADIFIWHLLPSFITFLGMIFIIGGGVLSFIEIKKKDSLE